MKLTLSTIRCAPLSTKIPYIVHIYYGHPSAARDALKIQVVLAMQLIPVAGLAAINGLYCVSFAVRVDAESAICSRGILTNGMWCGEFAQFIVVGILPDYFESGARTLPSNLPLL